MISIFNGRSRGLGNGVQTDIYLQVSVHLRAHLHLFRGAKLGVFLAIALHSDQRGWANPPVRLLQRETGYNKDTVTRAITELIELTVDGHAILLRDQSRNLEGKYHHTRYLIFPTPEEVARFDPPHPSCPKKPDPEKPEPEKPGPENQCTVIRNKNNHPERITTGEEEPHTGGVGSRFSRAECRAYADYLHSTGQGIRKPAGFAAKIQRTGQADESIASWLALEARRTAAEPPGQSDPHKLDLFLETIRGKLNPTAFREWFNSAKLSTEDGRVYLQVASELAREWIAANYSDIVEESMVEIGMGGLRLEIISPERD